MRTLVCFVVALAALGCNSAPAVVEVTGTVTLDGKPLAKASVQFQPVPRGNSIEAPGPGSWGETDQMGNYSLTVLDTNARGAIVGEHKVVIRTAYGPVKGDAVGTKEKLPARYNTATELSYTVKAGQPMVANWELKSP